MTPPIATDDLTTGVSEMSTSSSMSYQPVGNQPDTFWQRDTHPMSNHQSTPELPEYSDIVIIGAGYAGVATTYHLLKEIESSGVATQPHITLLEARGACSGATGRNGGHLRPDMYGHIPNYINRAGLEAGVELAEFEIANMYAIKKVIEEEGIDCDFTLARSVDVWCNEEAAAKAKAMYDAMVARGIDYLKDVFFVTGEAAAEGYSGVKGAKAAASFTAGTMWPYKFILNLLQPMVESGKINLQTHTPVSSVKPNTVSEKPEYKFSVTTQRGTIYAKQVVHTSNAYVAGLLPEYEQSIVPCKGICCHIAVPDGTTRTAPLLNNSYINRTSENVLSYLIPRTDGSIVVGGAAAKFFPYRDQWYRNVDDGCLIEAAKDFYDDYMQRTYRGWEDSGAKVTKIWTGVMGYSFDSNPHVGRVPDKKGQYVAAGFNGHGMPVIWLVAKGIAKMVLSDARANDDGALSTFAESGLPRLFETSKKRIERAKASKEEHGDILGAGEAFLPAGKITG